MTTEMLRRVRLGWSVITVAVFAAYWLAVWLTVTVSAWWVLLTVPVLFLLAFSSVCLSRAHKRYRMVS